MKFVDDKIALILAAGKGKRMRSGLPKVLHKLNGKYIIDYIIQTARKAGFTRQILVIGYKAELVEEALRDRGVEFVLQPEQLGTGHAVMMAQPLLGDFQGDLVVLCGDMPLVKAETISSLLTERQRLKASAVVLTAILDNPGNYGRIVRARDGLLRAIVEYRDADNIVRKIREVNTGAYCFDWKELKQVLGQLKNDNDQKELYLTDSISILVAQGKRVGAVVAGDPREGLGVNSLEELHSLESALRDGTRFAL